VFDAPHGADGAVRPFVLVLVGATIVGSMSTVWHGVVNPPRPGHLREWTYDDPALRFEPGQEMGSFLLGSTVVLLWPPDTIAFIPQWAPGQPVRLGEAMGELFKNP
jgi:phosphatidylserine decarboxylase